MLSERSRSIRPMTFCALIECPLGVKHPLKFSLNRANFSFKRLGADRKGPFAFHRSFSLDEHPVILDDGLVDFDGDHAGRRHHFASLDVELAIVKIALDDLTLDEPF
jgi:hypothetical protein